MSSRAVVSIVLLLWIVSLPGPAFAAEGSARIVGAIVRASDLGPIPGARLHAGDPETGEVYSSRPAGPAGRFELAGLPASTYELAIEADGGAYRVDTPLTIEDGGRHKLNLSVRSAAILEQGQVGSGGGGKKANASGGFFKHPALAILTTVGAAAVIGFALDSANESRSASEFEPGE